MLIIDGREKLEYYELVKFFRELKGNDILVTFTYNNESEENLEQRNTIVRNLFNRSKIRHMKGVGYTVSLFNENVLLETTIDEIFRLSTPSRIEKFLELTGVDEVDEITDSETEDFETEELTVDEPDIPQEPKPQPVVEEKTIAIGLLDGDTIIEIESIDITRKETKKAVEFLNERISRYYVHKLQDHIRINVNYHEVMEIDLSEWLTINELFEKGIAK